MHEIRNKIHCSRFTYFRMNVENYSIERQMTNVCMCSSMSVYDCMCVTRCVCESRCEKELFGLHSNRMHRHLCIVCIFVTVYLCDEELC